jgi:hypothetical protein
MMQRPHAIPVALPRGPEHYWREMIARGAKGFTIRDIAFASDGVTYAAVKTYIRWLLKQGYLVKTGERPTGYGRADVYGVCKASRAAPTMRRDDYAGQRGEIQQALWRAMRSLGPFTLPELAFAASTDERVVKVRTAETYVRRLARAGAIEIVEPYKKGAKGAPGAKAGRYALKRSANTGPKAPKIFAAEIVFDPNANRVLGDALVTEGRA